MRPDEAIERDKWVIYKEQHLKPFQAKRALGRSVKPNSMLLELLPAIPLGLGA